MKCWYCGENSMHQAMDLGWWWFKCDSCGATHQEKPTKGSHFKTVEIEADPIHGTTKYRPSDSVAREAKKAREKAK